MRAGEGPGIEPFRPNRGPLQLSKNLIIENLAKVLEVAPETIDTVADTAVVGEGAETGNVWRPWSDEEALQAIGALESFAVLPSRRKHMGIAESGVQRIACQS